MCFGGTPRSAESRRNAPSPAAPSPAAAPRHRRGGGWARRCDKPASRPLAPGEQQGNVGQRREANIKGSK